MNVKLIDYTPQAMERVLYAARTCYAKPPREADASRDRALIVSLKERNHWTPFEFVSATFEIQCDRAVANALTRHRHASFMQESTHFINYAKREIEYEVPEFEKPGQLLWYESAMKDAGRTYCTLVKSGVPHEVARCVLPLGLRTKLLMCVNARSLRHIIELRACGTTGKDQMHTTEVVVEMGRRIHSVWPWLVDDLVEKKLLNL